MSYKVNTRCRCCASKKLHTYLDLGEQPLANNYHHKDLDDMLTYPLQVQLCLNCFHSQLSVVVDPEEMFCVYPYATGTNETIKKFSKEFAESVTKTMMRHDLISEPEKVLDIACNDGTQLNAFKELGWETYGVDPATNIAPIAKEKGHDVICDYWNSSVALNMKKETGAFNLIIAQNVFAHVDDVLGFLEACDIIMHDKSLLIVQTSQRHMFERNEFDTIYHEHLSFFNVNSMVSLLERAGMTLEQVREADIHGGSYVFYISRFGGLLPSNVSDIQAQEEAIGLYDAHIYDRFAHNTHSLINELTYVVNNYQSSGHIIVGYGAAAKGMTVLNASDFYPDFIIDDSPLKQGLFTPGKNIPIHSSEELKKLDDVSQLVFVPLAWNFFDEILQKIKTIRPKHNDIIIKYFPIQEVIET